MGKAKSIVQSSNGDLRDKVWDRDVSSPEHLLGVAACRWTPDYPLFVHL
jgi:hypothetical protein